MHKTGCRCAVQSVKRSSKWNTFRKLYLSKGPMRNSGVTLVLRRFFVLTVDWGWNSREFELLVRLDCTSHHVPLCSQAGFFFFFKYIATMTLTKYFQCNIVKLIHSLTRLFFTGTLWDMFVCFNLIGQEVIKWFFFFLKWEGSPCVQPFVVTVHNTFTDSLNNPPPPNQWLTQSFLYISWQCRLKCVRLIISEAKNRTESLSDSLMHLWAEE